MLIETLLKFISKSFGYGLWPSRQQAITVINIYMNTWRIIISMTCSISIANALEIL